MDGKRIGFPCLSSVAFLFYSSYSHVLTYLRPNFWRTQPYFSFLTTYPFQYGRYNLPVDDLEVHCCVPHPLKIIAT